MDTNGKEDTEFKARISWITNQRSGRISGCYYDQLLQPLNSHKNQALEVLTQNTNNLARLGVSCFTVFKYVTFASYFVFFKYVIYIT